MLFCSGFVPRTEERMFLFRRPENVWLCSEELKNVWLCSEELKNVWFCSEELKNVWFCPEGASKTDYDGQVLLDAQSDRD